MIQDALCLFQHSLLVRASGESRNIKNYPPGKPLKLRAPLRHGIVRQAFRGSLQYHGLFGEVVLRSPAVSSKIPYSLKDIFKFVGTLVEMNTLFFPS